MNNRPFSMASIVVAFACGLLLSSAQAQTHENPQKHFPRVERMPQGANVTILGTLRGNFNARTEFVFEAPLGPVWLAARQAASTFEKLGGRPVVTVDEQNHRVQNGIINRDSMISKSGFSNAVDEFVIEVTRLSDDKTQVSISRRIMRQTRGRWGLEKSNGKYEDWILTQVEDNLSSFVPSENNSR